jgi:hypothetical protein
MKREISGLRSGTYESKDESVFLRVRKTDEGVIIEVVDRDADIFYAFTITEKQEHGFEWGQLSTAQ